MAVVMFINRKGTLHTKAQDANQCAFTGHSEYQYHLRIECLPKFDSNGFIIDHRTVDAALQTVANRKKIGSCEQFSIALVQAAEQALDRGGADWLAIHLILKSGPNPEAWMETKKDRISRR